MGVSERMGGSMLQQGGPRTAMIADPVPPRRRPRLAKPWSEPQVAPVEIAIEIAIGIGIGIGIGIDTIMTLGHSPLDVHSLSIGGLD
jgi:hypothetical protein